VTDPIINQPYLRSMIAIRPFETPCDSVLPLWSQAAQARRSTPDARAPECFVFWHGRPQGFLWRSGTLGQDCNPTAIVAASNVKLARKAQADKHMEVDGDDWRHSSDADTLHPQGVSAILISPALSDPVPPLEPSPSFKMAEDLTFGMLAHTLRSTQDVLNPYVTILLMLLQTILWHLFPPSSMPFPGPSSLRVLRRAPHVPSNHLQNDKLGNNDKNDVLLDHTLQSTWDVPNQYVTILLMFLQTILRHLFPPSSVPFPGPSSLCVPRCALRVPSNHLQSDKLDNDNKNSVLLEGWAMRGMAWVGRVFERGCWECNDDCLMEMEMLDAHNAESVHSMWEDIIYKFFGYY
jgi:hypothetical protein